MADKNEGLGAAVERYMRRFYADSDEEICPVGVYDSLWAKSNAV